MRWNVKNILTHHCFRWVVGGTLSPDPFDLGSMNENLPSSTGAIKKTPQSFLGENSALVNLDNLVSTSTIKPASPTPAGNVSFEEEFFAFSKKFQNIILKCIH